MMGKIPLVLWTGGADSTFMLNELLSSGQNVDVLYVSIPNNASKIDRELQAMYDIKDVWHKRDVGGILDTIIAKVPEIPSVSNMLLPQPVLFASEIAKYYNPKRHSSIHTGVLLGDSVTRVWREYMTAIRSMIRLAQYDDTLEVRVVTPFDKSKSKYDIVSDFIDEDPELYVRTTSCEYDVTHSKCNCKPCLTRKMAEYAVSLTNLIDYEKMLDLRDEYNLELLDAKLETCTEKQDCSSSKMVEQKTAA